MPEHSSFVLVLLAGSLIMACSHPLDTKGAVRVSVLNEDTSLAAVAEKTGIRLSQKVDARSWYPRILADIKNGSAAELYAAEWSRELLELSREDLLARTEAFWKRTSFAASAPRWFQDLPVGPLNGFLPTAAYLWGLFINQEKLSELGLPAPVDFTGLESLFAKAKAAGITPIALGAAYGWPGAAWFTMLDLHMNGARSVRERYAGTRRWDDEGAKTVASRLASWRDLGYFSPNAAGLGMPESVAAMESGGSLCVLMGTFAVERMRNADAARFIAFPNVKGSQRRAELIGLSGFAVPKAGFVTDGDGELKASSESAMALADAYIRAGSPGQAEGSYKVPLVYATTLPAKQKTESLPEIAGIKAVQAELLRDADGVVLAFDQAVSSQAVQNSIPLWSAFFGPQGRSGDDFALALQKAMEAGR